MQTVFQIYLLKNEGKASNTLWTAKFIYTFGCYAWLSYYYITRKSYTNSEYYHLVSLWIIAELVSVIVETLYYDIFWLFFYRDYLKKYYLESQYKVLDERYFKKQNTYITTLQKETSDNLENNDFDFFAEVREELTQKDSIEFDENFYSLTVLCFLKDVKAKYALSSNMQNSNFFNCV